MEQCMRSHPPDSIKFRFLGGEITDGIRLPAPIAIAHRLIRDWAEN
jgi:hypothetical protein